MMKNQDMLKFLRLWGKWIMDEVLIEIDACDDIFMKVISRCMPFGT